MKKVFLFCAFALLSLASCSKDSGVNLGSTDDLILESRSRGADDPIVTNGITIPASVFSFVASRYAGYRITEVERELEHGVTYYKVKIRNGKSDIRLLFTTNWVFVGVKN